MKKLLPAALGLAVAILPVLGVGVATAQDERDCNRAQREVTRLELRLATVLTEERNAEDAAVKLAEEALATAETGGNQAAINAAKEVLKAAKEALNVDSNRLARVRADVAAAVETRDEACDEDPTPTPTPTPTPAPTTPPAADDVDCDEVTDERAQEILDADRSDPHNLDEDNDGVACEVELELNPKPVVVPQGGVQTDGGVE